MGLIAEKEKRRAVAHLQQKAQAFETEVALRQSEERFRLLVEGIQDYAIYSMDPHGVITSWNSGARRIKGYTSEEVIGQNFSRFYTSEDVERGLPGKVLQIAREEGHYEGEGWRIRKDGSRFWSNVVVTPLRDEAGNVLGFSKITRDMTERKLLMDRIQEHAEELDKAQESLRRLTARLLQVQDDERRRLARELHDGAGQILAALNMNLESLQDAVKEQIAPSLNQRLAESIRLANQVIKETRTLSYLLHPPLLDEAGLRDALHWFVGGFIERSGIQTELEISPNFSRLPRELETAIFRIIQESVTNIHRHSGSPKASIHLALDLDKFSSPFRIKEGACRPWLHPRNRRAAGSLAWASQECASAYCSWAAALSSRCLREARVSTRPLHPKCCFGRAISSENKIGLSGLEPERPMFVLRLPNGPATNAFSRSPSY